MSVIGILLILVTLVGCGDVVAVGINCHQLAASAAPRYYPNGRVLVHDKLAALVTVEHTAHSGTAVVEQVLNRRITRRQAKIAVVPTVAMWVAQVDGRVTVHAFQHVDQPAERHLCAGAFGKPLFRHLLHVGVNRLSSSVHRKPPNHRIPHVQPWPHSLPSSTASGPTK